MITILLVDHAVESNRSVRELWANAPADNFTLDRVLSYREILKGFRNKSYDVCVIDSGFGNGLKLFAQARRVGCTAPIVLVTSNKAGEVLEAMRSGIADCLVRDELNASRIEGAICSVVEQARGAALRREHERRYRALLDNANAIIYTHDLAGMITSINRAGERLIGYSQEEILGLHVSLLVEPAYRGQVRKMIERTLDAQAQVVERIEFVTKEGQKLTGAVGVHPTFKDGKATEIQGVVTTVHALPASHASDTRDFFGSHPENGSSQKRKAMSSIPASHGCFLQKERQNKSVTLVH